MATILDPRFKKEGFRLDFNAKEGDMQLEREMSVLAATHSLSSPSATVTSTCSSSVTVTEDQQTNPPHTDAQNQSCTTRPLFGFLHQKLSSKVRSSRVDAIIVKRQYLERANLDEHADPLLFWKVSFMPIFCKCADC